MNVKDWVSGKIKKYEDWSRYYFNFGKYKNKSIWEVFEIDPQYFEWVFLNARMRLNPEIDAFIKENHQAIIEAKLLQEQNEKNLFQPSKADLT